MKQYKMRRSDQFVEGTRFAAKRIIRWLHAEAKNLDDPAAKALLGGIAHQLGNIEKAMFFDSLKEEV
jgi:hypothetical protein